MRLADQDRLAAELLIEAGERARAIDQRSPRSTTRSGLAQTIGSRRRDEPLEQRAIVLRRLGGVVEEPGAAHELGLRFGTEA